MKLKGNSYVYLKPLPPLGGYLTLWIFKIFTEWIYEKSQTT